jgi:5-formyltetrahydrofolate cyclo-ligase
MATPDAKALLRHTLVPRLRQVTVSEAVHASTAVRTLLRTCLAKIGSCALAAYAALPYELDPGPLVDDYLAAGTTVYYPRHTGEGYRLFPISSRATLQPRRYGILEPPQGSLISPIPPPGIPLVWLVPGIAFDRAGNRLGRGAGFFDRLLADYPGLRLGLAYDWQMVAEVPTAAHDQAMDVVVTESRIIWCRQMSSLAVRQA